MKNSLLSTVLSNKRTRRVFLPAVALAMFIQVLGFAGESFVIWFLSQPNLPEGAMHLFKEALGMCVFFMAMVISFVVVYISLIYAYIPEEIENIWKLINKKGDDEVNS